MPKISVVMCCFNSARYIKETIDSVLNQTFKDFEFIIWNDGSTDSTEEIIFGYQDARIKYFKDKNQGEGKAANMACTHVESPYIARIDSDDVWMPNKLARQFEYMESHQNVVLVSCSTVEIDSNSKYLSTSFPVTRTKFLNKSINDGNRFVHSGSMYRTELYRKVGGYPELRMFQDYLLFKRMSGYGDLALLADVLVKYRVLSNSVEHRVRNSPYYGVIREYVKKIIEDRGENPKDLLLFNSIYELIPRTQSSEESYKLDWQNKIYNVLSLVFGRTLSYKIIVCIKNLYSYLLV